MSRFALLKSWLLEIQSKVWTILTAALVIVVFYFLAKNLDFADMIIRKSGVFAPLVALGIYAVLGLTPISTDPITAISGVLFGPVLGILVSWMGNNIGAVMEYQVGKRVGNSEKFSTIKEKLPFGLNKLPISSPYVLIFGRMIPSYGGKVINFMAGMYGVSMRTFLWTTLLINVAGSILLSFGGYIVLYV